jgi:UDP-glucose 4-epimerase
MRDERVLVTGGAGFVGSTLANHLAADNEVVAVDDLHLGDPENLDSDVAFVEASVVGDDWPTDVDVVFHLAALSSRSMLEENPQAGTRVNVEGTVNVFEHTRDHADSVVFAGTSSMYDDSPPASEDDPVQAATCYEASMLARDRYMEYYNDYYDDVHVASTRFSSVYQGYGGNEAHKGEYANTVSQWAAKMADGETPVLWDDGSQTRDYVHVSDVVRAMEAVADNRLEGSYNVGTGRNFSFNETVDLLNDALGTDIEPEYEPVPLTNYNYQQRFDISKLRAVTSWEPQVDFETGVETVCAPYVD